MRYNSTNLLSKTALSSVFIIIHTCIYHYAFCKSINTHIYSGFGSTDISYSTSISSLTNLSESIQLQGWKGERVNCILLIWNTKEKNKINIKSSQFHFGKKVLDKKITTISTVEYVLADAYFTGCSAREKDKYPKINSPDILLNGSTIIIDSAETQPVWISINIPSNAPVGVYEGSISIQSKSINKKHNLTLEVLNKTLPTPKEWSFHLDLWQNPYSVARFNHVKLWSRQHINLLRPLLTMLAQAGQKCITTTIVNDPWAGQTYDPYGSMIKWIKKTDGTWKFDYSNFDLYVHLAMESGITEQINCYSMVPVGNKFSWHDEKSSKNITVEYIPGTKDYEDMWRSFLHDFKSHLLIKGWLYKTAIALDEREEEEMEKMFNFLKATAPELKISMAGFYYSKINSSIYDFSSNWRHIDKVSENSLAARKTAGLKTTYYVACGIPKPNNFTFSAPAESCYQGWFASAMGLDGFLRWAFNSWPQNPMEDSRFIRWPSGDTYLVYPNAQSSVRFERLREGIQDFEKLRILRKELAANPSKKSIEANEKLINFLHSINTKTLESHAAAEVINEGKSLINDITKSVYKI